MTISFIKGWVIRKDIHTIFYTSP